MDITGFAYLFVGLLGIYLLTGLVFSIVLLVKGLSTLDPNTKTTGIGFKILMMPGIIAFWPILWRKWKRT